MKEYPEAFMDRMNKLLGDEFGDFRDALNDEPIRAFRVNVNKMSVQRFLGLDDLSIGRVPYVETGFYMPDIKAGAHPFHHAGIIYVQEPAAMMPIECADIRPGMRVLDLCAAPGGKAGQIAEKLGESGVLVANEIVPQRCRVLTGNIERLGFSNTMTTCADPTRLAECFPGFFDIVNVDAPCSGEGMFRKDPKAVAEWNESSPARCAERQMNILENAAVCLKAGGTLIYSTCTFSLEENEMTVDRFLSENEEFELVPVPEKIRQCTSDGVAFDGCVTKNISDCRRFYPHKAKGEGQFVAVMKKLGEGIAPSFAKSSLEMCREKPVFDFLSENLEEYDKSRVLMNKDTPVFFIPDFSVPKGLAFSCGVTIGEIRGSNIKPHHQLFSAMGRNFKRKLDFGLNSHELKKYLRGETVDVDCENGFAAVLCEGAPVGGGKVVDGRLKNHYPRGLRLV